MNDDSTSVSQLRAVVARFVTERDWEQFHSPKNLSMALAIEAAELMEHFQWITPEASRQISGAPEQLAEVGEELADVLCYVLAMANSLNIDLTTTLHAKMVKNAQKYPVEVIRGRFGHEDKGNR